MGVATAEKLAERGVENKPRRIHTVVCFLLFSRMWDLFVIYTYTPVVTTPVYIYIYIHIVLNSFPGNELLMRSPQS